MCGPSGSQKSLANSSSSAAQQYFSNYKQTFANQSAALSHINSVLSPIISAGPSQNGFSASENAALNTQAIDSNAGNYASAARTTGAALAGRGGGGTPGLESGVDQQIQGSLAGQAAGNLSNEQLGITEANAATGRQNFENALNSETAVAGLENPNAAGNLAVSGNQQAFGEASTINQENNQEEADIAGGIAGIGMDALTFGSGAMGGGGVSGGLRALTGAA